MDHDFCGAERAKTLSCLDRGLFSGDGTDLRLVPEKDVDMRETDSDRFDPLFWPPPRIRRHVQRGRRTESAGAGEKRRGRFPHESARPPEPGPMHVMRPSNRLNRNVAKPQTCVGPRVRAERAPPGGPRQGNRASRGSAWTDAQTAADAVLPTPIAQEPPVRIGPHPDAAPRRGTQARAPER